MEILVAGRVVGHKLFQPNPKDAPEIEVAKVTLVIASMSKATTKATTATVHVDPEETSGDFALGRTVSLTFRDWQQELGLDTARLGTTAGGERYDPETGELLGDGGGSSIESVTLTTAAGSVTTTPARMRQALDEVKSSRRRRSSITH